MRRERMRSTLRGKRIGRILARGFFASVLDELRREVGTGREIPE